MATYPTNPNVATYDPKKMLVTIGTIPITGWADGDFITITQPEDTFTKVRGADGMIERVLRHVLDAEITISLMRGSPINDALTTLFLIDREEGLGKVPFLLKDLNSTTTIASFLQCWIKKLPDLVGSTGDGQKEWVVDTGPGLYFPGSNFQ